MLAFEWRYHTHRFTFALVALVLCGMAYMMVKTGYGADSALVNSPYAVTQSYGLLALWTLFTQTIFCVHGALRDDEHSMRELILSRPVGRWRYLASRYVGVVMAGTGAMLLATIVLFVLPFVLPFDAGRIGAPLPGAYAWAMVALVIPDIVLISALLFAVAAFARNTLATYVGAIALFGLYTVVAMLTESPFMAGSAPATPEKLALAAVLDPFGLSAFFEQTRYWTPSERNMRLLSLSGNFLVNRVVWTGVAGAVLAFTYRFVSLGATSDVRVRRGSKTGLRVTSAPNNHAPTAPYAAVTPTTHLSSAFGRALWSTFRLELRLILQAWIFRALMMLWILIFGVEVMQELGSGDYGTRLLATTGLMIERLADPLRLVGTLCVVYFSAEIVGRERQVHVDMVIDATPASNGVFCLAKLLALCALPIVMTTIGLSAALILQLVVKGAPVQLDVYAAQFWFTSYPLVLFAVLAIALQVLTGSRWAGMVAAFLAAVIAVDGSPMGLEHPMWRFGAAPTVSYSDLDGFGPAAASFAAFMGYWSAFALMLVVVTWAAWQRGYDPGIWARLRRGLVLPRMRSALLTTAGLFIVSGALLFHETNVVHAWENSDDARIWQADYEQQYRRYAGVDQPSVVAITMAVDFTPSHRRATVRGRLTLRNRASRPIDTVLVMMRAGFLDAQATIGGDSAMSKDVRFGTWRFGLAQPLLPGDSVILAYSLTLDRGGIRAGDFARDVAANGSYLSGTDAMPTIGYRSGYEIRDRGIRRRLGLGEPSGGLAPLEALDSLVRDARRAGNQNAWITLHSTVSSADGQQPLANGTLIREWSEGDRVFAEYRIDSLMPARVAFGSGRYAVARVQHGAINVELWYHPTHGTNTQRMTAAATQALDILGARFGAYSHGTLRMVEVPSGWPFGAFAMSDLLMFSEDRGMLSDPRSEDVDLITRRVAHEVAHHWWGYTVDPLHVVGATTIVESLAKYSEQLVVASLHGEQAVVPILAFDHDRYLAGRASDGEREPTLLTASDEPYIYYGKGALAMHALHDALGDSTMMAVLRAFIDRERGPFGAATATQLYEMLRAAAGANANGALVDEWFTGHVLYEMRVDSATATRHVVGASSNATTPSTSRYRVRATFDMQRIVVKDGVEQVQPATAITVDVAVHGIDGALLYAAKVPVVNGRVVLSAVVSAEPMDVEIDHMIRRIDRDRSNNRKRVVIHLPSS